MINFPYAVSNFSLLREKNYLYLDRSAYIRELEAADRQILFLRPRRFGKSLFLSTLASYYDVDQADQFESLFGDLNIGQNPTEERNQYLILRWDFSKVSAQGDIEQIKRSLFNHLNRTIEAFQVHYQQYLKHPIYIDPEDGITSFESLLGVVGNSGYQLYLLIDEYDNFANEVLMHNQGDKQRYLAMLEGEGIVKTLFKVIKAGASEGPISRVFITGVSPMVMSDMTSGYNVVTNISLNNEFSSLCGITAPELRTLVEQVVDQDKSQIQPIMDTLRQFYNGYRFVPSEDSITLYNPILCFHFLRNYQKEQKPPRNLLDGNLAMDTGRIRYIAQLKGGQDMVDWALDEQNSASLPKLAEDFGIANLERARNDGDYMLSLLYYFGVLTLDGMDDFGSLKLKIPNLVVRGLYLEEIKRQALPDVAEEYAASQLAMQFYRDAALQKVIDFMEQKYFKVFSNRDYRWSNELTIKTAFASILFNDIYYVLDSEAELGRRYSDLMMIIRPNMRQYPGLKDFVMEFKYLSLDDVGLSGEQLRSKSIAELEALPKVQKALQEASSQLAHYQQVLIDKYQEPERLHCMAVVALGFERMVWQKLP